MQYAIFIAICTSMTPAQDCDRNSALHWMNGPASDQAHGLFAGLSACQVIGMQYAAESRLVTPGTYGKIFCQPLRPLK